MIRPGALSLISEDNPELGLLMTYEGGNMCNETDHYQLVVQINCNPNLQTTTYQLDQDSLKTPCDPKVIMSSPSGCPVLTTGPLGVFIEKYAYWIGLPMLVIGGYLMSKGGRFPRTTLAMFSAISVTNLLLFILYLYVLPSFAPVWTVWIVGVVCVGMGGGLGFGAAKWPRIGIMCMGASLGSLLGYIIYWLFLKQSLADSNSAMLKQMIIFVVALVTVLVCLFLFDEAVIITSGVFGAYIFVRGISMYSGSYINEFEIIMASSNGQLSEVGTLMYVYWFVMVLLAFFSIRGQLRDRQLHLEAYAYKGNIATSLTSYRNMREKFTKKSYEPENGNKDYSDS